MPYPAFVCEYRTLCLRGAVLKAERRTDWCQVHGLTLQLQQRPQGLFSSVLGFLFTPHVSPFGRDRQEKDGLNWHSHCLRWHFFPLLPFWHVSNNLHVRSNLLLPWCTNCRENALTRGENTLMAFQLLAESIVPSLSVCCWPWRSCSLCFSFPCHISWLCFIRKLILFLNVCPELVLTEMPRASF